VKPDARTALRGALTLAATSVCVLAAAQQSPAPADTFRGRTDVVTLDVTVLDGDRKPMRGLTANDFVILDGDEPRPVEAFSAVELPPPAALAPAGSSTITDVARDVTGNEPAAGRLVAILLDRSVPFGWPTFAARRIARAAVNALGPANPAAVIHTGVGLPQEFTNDRRRLLAAIDAPGVGLTLAQPDPLTLQPEFQTGECPCGVCTLEAITRVAKSLEQAPERQKLLLFIGGSLPLASPVAHGDKCSVYVQPATHAMLRATQQAHLTVDTFDPNGLNPPASAKAQALMRSEVILAGPAGSQAAVQAPEALLALAAKTGGRAVLNSNEPEHELPAIFNETSAYYVVGFAPSPSGLPGTFRSVKVSVRHPGAHVRTRSGYYVPDTTSEANATPADPLVAAVRDLLPHTGVQLQLDPLPFPSATPGADISFVLRVTRDKVAVEHHAAVDVLGVVYDTHGDAVASQRHTAQPAGQADTFEETFTLHVPSPGAYQVRVAALDDGRTGSVYGFADVPDFRRAPVSLSGVGINPGAARTEATAPVQTGGQPKSATLTLTVARAFTRTDRPTAVAYVCQSSAGALQVVKASGTIFDVTGHSVLRRTDTLQPASFAAGGCASYQIGLPLDQLGPGEYVLTVDASRDANDASRSVRFRVDE
jgi:VWFA-related protein